MGVLRRLATPQRRGNPNPHLNLNSLPEDDMRKPLDCLFPFQMAYLLLGLRWAVCRNPSPNGTPRLSPKVVLEKWPAKHGEVITENGCLSGKFQPVANFGKPTSPYLREPSLTFTRVAGKVPTFPKSSGEGAFCMWAAFRMYPSLAALWIDRWDKQVVRNQFATLPPLSVDPLKGNGPSACSTGYFSNITSRIICITCAAHPICFPEIG